MGRMLRCGAAVAALLAVLAGLVGSGLLLEYDVPHRLALLTGRPELVGGFPAILSKEQRARSFRFEHLKEGSLKGRVAVITGANAGVGFQSAHQLARLGATVVLGCRSEAKCREAIKEIEALPGGRNGKLVPLALDTASLASVRAFAQALKAAQLGTGVDILMLNAGIALNNSPGASHLTADGVETVWATNVLGHVYLAELLGEAVEAAAAKAPKGSTRIVIVSSASNYGANAATVRPQLTTLEGVNGIPQVLSSTDRYEVTKFANVLMAQVLAKKHPRTLVSSLHPGVVATSIWDAAKRAIRRIGGPAGDTLVAAFEKIQYGVMWSAQGGALTQVYLAASPELRESGKYYHPVAHKQDPNPLALGKQGEELGDALFAFCSKLLRERGF